MSSRPVSPGPVPCSWVGSSHQPMTAVPSPASTSGPTACPTGRQPNTTSLSLTPAPCWPCHSPAQSPPGPPSLAIKGHHQPNSPARDSTLYHVVCLSPPEQGTFVPLSCRPHPLPAQVSGRPCCPLLRVEHTKGDVPRFLLCDPVPHSQAMY